MTLVCFLENILNGMYPTVFGMYPTVFGRYPKVKGRYPKVKGKSPFCKGKTNFTLEIGYKSHWVDDKLHSMKIFN